MLTRILAEQISSHWEEISFSIEQSLPPFIETSEARMSSILIALLSDILTCWISTNKKGDIDAIATTQILSDFTSDTKTLLIYSTYGFNYIEEDSWISAFNTIREYARNKKCSKISCYTINEKIIEQAKKFGGELQTFISFKI